MTDTTEKFLNGPQAAEFLGVKPSTLYAYVSRGLIESSQTDSKNARERSYRLSDLIKLRQSTRGFKTGRDQEINLWTGPVIKSAITDIGEEGHLYRGQSAIALAVEDTPFEIIAEMLWDTGNDGYQIWKETKPFEIAKQVRTVAAQDVDYLDLLKLLLVSTEIDDPVCRKLDADDIFDTARRIIITMATTLGIKHGREEYVFESQNPVAKTILWGLAESKSPEKARLINCALALCADHELNASALAARIAASCDAPVYSSLLAALGTFSGSMHGSASRRAEDIVRTSMQFSNARSWLKDYLRQSPSIPGFGTELYLKGDPRARTLLELARHASGRNRQLQRLLEIVESVQELVGLEPNLDIGLAAISYALNLPTGSGSAIFAISRTSGWIAHAIEQRLYGGTIRPRARYIGKNV